MAHPQQYIRYNENTGSPETFSPSSYKQHCRFYKVQNPSSIERIEQQYGQLDFLKPIQSNHDYLDEVFGATLIPLLMTCEFAFSLIRALYISLDALYKSISNSNPQFLTDASAEIYNKLPKDFYILALGIYCGLKSLASLVTRPVATVAADTSIVTKPLHHAAEAAAEVAADMIGYLLQVVDDATKPLQKVASDAATVTKDACLSFVM